MLTMARYLVAGAIALAVVAVAALGVVIVLHGGVSTTAPSIAGLISILTALGTLLTVALGGGAVVNAMGSMQKQLNGHLQAHIDAAHAAGQAAAQAQEGPPTGTA